MSWDDAFNLIPHIDIPAPCVFVETNDMTEEEKAKFPHYKTIGGYLKEQIKPLTETFPEAWKKLNEERKQKWLNLPNFNAEKFLKITGVDVRVATIVPATPIKRTIILDGILYELTRVV